MNELNENLLEKIESILKIKFYDWQKDYILKRPQILDMRITGRCTGKTIAHIIKTLFSDEKPIKAYDFKEVEAYSDWFSVTNREERKNANYTHFYKAYLKETYEILVKNRIEPRMVFFNRGEEDNYYREQMRINFRVNTELCPSCGAQKYWEDEYHCRICGKKTE